MSDYPQELLDILNSVSGKRPKTVIDHILAHGFITTEELKEIYGYDHAPRAARDVKELGIPLVSYKVKGKNGRSIAAYKFGSLSDLSKTVSNNSGRTAFTKALKQALISHFGSRCFIYLEEMGESLLQIDHRVPYEISGDTSEQNIEAFMLLSPSANREKSWACEHCSNWVKKDREFCLKCFWASPESYEHIAGKPEKAIYIVFTEKEIDDYLQLINLSGIDKAQDAIKSIIHEYIQHKKAQSNHETDE